MVGQQAVRDLAEIESGKLQPAAMSRSEVNLGIVCPMTNEGDQATAFCQDVLKNCSGFQKVTFFAVFDRATKDESLERMRELERSEPRLRVVWAPEDRCVVDAYLRGFKEALADGSDWILEIDAGFSHQPGDIPRFFDAMEQGMEEPRNRSEEHTSELQSLRHLVCR